MIYECKDNNNCFYSPNYSCNEKSRSEKVFHTIMCSEDSSDLVSRKAVIKDLMKIPVHLDSEDVGRGVQISIDKVRKISSVDITQYENCENSKICNEKNALENILDDIQARGEDFTDYEIYGMRLPQTISNEDVASKLIEKGVTFHKSCYKAESSISETGLMCSACYSDIDRDAVFCKYCGAKTVTR